jgi:hypothetical protein
MAVLESSTLELQMEIAPELTSSTGNRPMGPASYATALACFGSAADGNFAIAVGTNQGTVKVGSCCLAGCCCCCCSLLCRQGAKRVAHHAMAVPSWTCTHASASVKPECTPSSVLCLLMCTMPQSCRVMCHLQSIPAAHHPLLAPRTQRPPALPPHARTPTVLTPTAHHPLPPAAGAQAGAAGAAGCSARRSGAAPRLSHHPVAAGCCSC